MRTSKRACRIILFNKPFRVLCRFGPSGDKATLADYIRLPNVYPAGRLDYDSEGLVILTDSGKVQHLVTDPRRKLPKRYLAQVEGTPDGVALDRLRLGVRLSDGWTLPAAAEAIDPPDVWERTPPIRYRARIPTAWIALAIVEGRNRQVRRMTAAVGHPTLRLIRAAVGPWSLGSLAPGSRREADLADLREFFPNL